MAACSRCVPKQGFSALADDIFAFAAPRTVIIKDWRIGASLITIQLAIALYIIVSFVTTQTYLKASSVATSVRLQTRAPDNLYRWPNSQPPYCTGTSAGSLSGSGYPWAARYSIPSEGGKYAHMGQPPAAQRGCLYLDAASTLPISESDKLFLPTYIRSTPQATTCAAVDRMTCKFGPAENASDPGVTEALYTADPELFTIRVDHSLTAPEANLARTGAQMGGQLLGRNQAPLDVCAPYAGMAAGCPAVVAVGVPGKPDTIPVASLLAAAGIASLDAPSGFDGKTYRQSGLSLIVGLTYSNYRLASAEAAVPGTGTFDTGEVQYTYTVLTTPAEYKLESASELVRTPNGTQRQQITFNGIRIILTTSGRVGYGDFQTALINLGVAASLLSLGILITSCLAFNCMRWSPVYKRLARRETASFSALRAAAATDPHAAEMMLREFKEDPFTVEPPPPKVVELLGRAQLKSQRQLQTAQSQQQLLGSTNQQPDEQLASEPGASLTSAAQDAAPIVQVNPLSLGASGGGAPRAPLSVHASLHSARGISAEGSSPITLSNAWLAQKLGRN